MIYTSYFAKFSKIPYPLFNNCYAISLFIPRFMQGLNIKHIPELAPTKYILNNYKNNNDIKQYTSLFIKKLNTLNPKTILSRFNNSVFLCYEAPDKFCHRYLVKDWLNSYFHETVCEELNI